MPGKLTSNGVGNLKRVGKYYDGVYGFFVQVYPTGAKCWQQRLMISGRRRTRGLGGFPRVGLADARAAACKNWLLVRDGGDPFGKPRAGIPTFEQAAAAVIEQNAPTWTDPKHPKDWRNTLARYVFPCFGKMLVSQIEIRSRPRSAQPHLEQASGDGSARAPAHPRDSGLGRSLSGYRTDNPAGPVHLRRAAEAALA